MANRVEWFEITCQDAAKARVFYGELFGWSFEVANPEMDYGVVDNLPDGAIGGAVAKAPVGDGGVTFYVTVDDLEGTLTRVASLGGQVIVPPTPLPDGMRFAQFTDPEGKRIGVVG